jgi:hypoxanthine phosphoribosyltransferase
VSGQPRFAHASEAELARILDYYAVEWQYEPRTFPIQWNLDGTVVESFSPDFYLPELDLFVELTTLRQSLVRRKNRKLRRLRELYPDLRVKLFYGKDFKALMLKYGRFDLAASLSGLEGQAVASRSAVLAEAETMARQAVESREAARRSDDQPVATLQPAAVRTISGAEKRTRRSRPSRGSRRRRGRRNYFESSEQSLS